MIKVGDLVRSVSNGILINPGKVGVVTEITQKKCWRTGTMGKAINWPDIEPEPHAIVMFTNSIITIPCVDLEVAD